MASTMLRSAGRAIRRSAGRAIRRSIPRALAEQQPLLPRCQARSLMQSSRLLISDCVRRTEPNKIIVCMQHSSSDPVARLDVAEKKMSNLECIKLELDRVESSMLRSSQMLQQLEDATRKRNELSKELHSLKSSMLRDGQILQQLENAIRQKNDRDERDARRRRVSVGATLFLGVAFCAKHVLFD